MKKFIIFLSIFVLLIVLRILFFQSEYVRIAIIQMKIKYNDREYNTSRAVDMINKAAEENIDIACLPESFDIGWMSDRTNELAEPIPNQTSKKLSECAKKNKIYIIATGIEKEDNRVFNSAYIINKEGKIISKYRKINISGADRWLKKRFYNQGNSLNVVETEYGRLGLAIGNDVIFKELDIIKELAKSGTKIAFLPSSWICAVDEKGENAKKVGIYMEEIFTGKAKDNDIILIGANAAGKEVNNSIMDNSEYIGHSIVAGLEKGLIGTGAYRQEEIVLVKIEKEN